MSSCAMPLFVNKRAASDQRSGGSGDVPRLVSAVASVESRSLDVAMPEVGASLTVGRSLEVAPTLVKPDGSPSPVFTSPSCVETDVALPLVDAPLFGPA